MSIGFSVLKFGGTSMGSLSAMQQAAKIVHSNPKARVVVVSATSGTTDQLLRIYTFQLLHSTSEIEKEITHLKSKHREIAKSLNLSAEQNSAFEKLLKELDEAISNTQKESLAQLDELLSFGERISSLLFSRALELECGGRKVHLLDARKHLRTNSHFGKGEPDRAETFALCADLRAQISETNDLWVTQGFIGANAQGQTTTLGRGGSDYSAALFAEALEAKECQIWTDVPGILTMDPNVVPTAKTIAEISFVEAAEMANFGAKVLHPSTLVPAMRSQIPVFVGSTFQPNHVGTRIIATPLSNPPLIRAIALRKKQALITISSLRMLNAHGFLEKIFGILARHQISVDLVTTSEVSVALTVDENNKDNQMMLDELREFADVQVEENMTSIAVIGNALHQTPGVASKVFQAVNSFNVRLICHGASANNICFLISSNEATTVATRLHQFCIEQEMK